MDKIKEIRSKFSFVDGNIDLSRYGKYRMGLTQSEIQEYLKARVGNVNIYKQYEAFTGEMLGSTCTSTVLFDKDGKEQEVLLVYRHDVQRFADEILLNVQTYFD